MHMRKDTRLFPLFNTASDKSWAGPGNKAMTSTHHTTLLQIFNERHWSAQPSAQQCMWLYLRAN